jgi:hypothetical protein
METAKGARQLRAKEQKEGRARSSGKKERRTNWKDGMMA